ncbi:MAG: tetratricopeptide repeat protein [Acidobacteria bacterium]|nr:tetratricopeptide repeat protein [Acidobacteriota bacterium]
MQRELSEDIVRQIHGRLSPERASTLARRQTSSPDAYDLYLRGLNFERQRTPPTTRRAVEYYEKATALDPGYSLAWAALAGTLTGSALNSDVDPGTVRDRAREAARRAIETGPDTAEAHRVMAMGQWYFEWDRWPEAEAGYRRALSIDPRSATTHLMLGHLLSQMGRHPEARQATLRARELEPLNPLVFALSSQVAFQGRDYTEAMRFAERAIALDGEFWIGYVMRGQALEQLGRNDAAIEALTMAERFSGQNSKPMSLRAYILARTGRANQAETMLDALDTASRDRYVPPYAMALISLGLGRRDRALDWLERALDVRDVHLIYLPVDPKWDALRSDPRFGSLLERCGWAGTGVAPG